MKRAGLWLGGVATLDPAANGDELAVGLWLDLDSGIVAMRADSPAGLDLGALLAQACREPVVGSPRRPARVRVADQRLASQVEQAKLGVMIEIGPTPEVDAVIDEFVGSVAPTGPTPPTSFVGRPWRKAASGDIERAEAAAVRLIAGAPWRRLDSEEDVRVQAPSLGCADATALVVGQLGQNHGFALFSHPAHAHAFRRHAEAGSAWSDGAQLDADFLMFDVEPPRDKRGAPRISVVHVGRDWEGVVADAAEIALLAAVADALARFDRNREVRVGPVTVGLRAPAPIVALARPAGKRPGRNDPCWCGSGKKYKRCHLDPDLAPSAAPAPSASDGRSPWHETNDALYGRIIAWAAEHLGNWDEHLAALSGFGPPAFCEAHAIFAIPYHGPGFLTVGERFRAMRGASLNDRERRWLDANIDSAWTSYWRVVDVVPGRTITLSDLFSEETRTVAEAGGSRSVGPHDLMCARVVTIGDDSYMDGCHQRFFGPREAARLRTEVAGGLGLTKRKAVPVAKLRSPKVVLGLLTTWGMLIRAHDERRPVLQNTDGEALVQVADRFAVTVARARLNKQLAALPGVEPGEPGTWTLCRAGNAMHASWETTIIARLRVDGAALVVETNSVARADAVRATLEAGLAGAVRHLERTTRDADALLAQAEAQRATRGPQPVAVPPLEVQAAVAEMKRRQYEGWPDAPLPALGGRSARQAVKTAPGRSRVAALLDDIERHELREPPAARYDVAILRRALGLVP